ncbi:MAG: hypothetical protein ACK4NS_02030 [Saprospiraceae bacterium]
MYELNKNLIRYLKNRFNQWAGAMNNFRDIQAAREEMLPPDIEHRLMHQVESYAHLGRIADLFIPTALKACVNLVGGGAVVKEPQSSEAEFDWRKKQF